MEIPAVLLAVIVVVACQDIGQPYCRLYGRKFVPALHNTCVMLQGIMTVLSTVSSPGVTIPQCAQIMLSQHVFPTSQ
ncbi:hypothetical protein D6C83_06103 [Aureobasidium pullulans]|uniref:Secreted protein n=1 Tax=Aureobasidium pullulans TaxID=5580 RepID=A0A4V4LGF3_AURPU|nr:hypothetical protein D6C83_06103 [Aureobasidium pullulans]